MTDGHQRHVSASLSAIEEVVRQMERAGQEGKSPVGRQALTPLDPKEWAAMAAVLARIQERLQAAVHRLAPELPARRDTVEGRTATLYWLSVLLLHLDEEVIADLDPSRTEPRFGPLEGEERVGLSELVKDLHSDVFLIRAHIERLRGEKGGSV
jgi:hypothetical protein